MSVSRFYFFPFAAATALVITSSTGLALADGPSGSGPGDKSISGGSSSGFREVQRRLRAHGASATVAGTEDPVAKVQAALGSITQSLASGAQVAVFPYRMNRIYQVDIKPGMFTTFTFPRDEVIRQFAVSNPEAVEISVNADTNAAMLRLNSPLTLSGTIVTDKRTYFVTIAPSSGAWHQGVSWSYDGEGDGKDGKAYSGFGYRAPAGVRAPADTGVPEPEDALSGHPNFDYVIDGDASILPVAVWDNGRFTWIQFPNSVQSLPAVFYLGPDGPEIVNYTVAPGGKQIKVGRLMSKILLRLGSQKVIITAR
jgi:type IV secretion system protein VirB9